MGSVMTCKLNPCCGDRRNCTPPERYDAAAPGPADAVSEAEVEAALAEWSKPNERREPAAIMRAALEAAQRARK